MRKVKLSILILSPVLIGFLFNILVKYIPSLGYPAPLILMAFWFYAGGVFAEENLDEVKSIVGANLLGVLSLALFCSQHMPFGMGRKLAMRFMFSPLISAPFSFFTGRVGFLFEATSHQVTSVTAMVMQGAALLVMILIFVGGYYYRKHKIQRQMREINRKNNRLNII